MDASETESDELLWCDDDEFMAIDGEYIATSQTSLASPDQSSEALAAVKQEPVEDLDELEDPVANEHAIQVLEEWAMTMLEEIVDGYDKSRFEFRLASCRKKSDTSRVRKIVWPSKRTPTLKTIAGTLKVAELAHLALKEEIPTTKRDVFYGDVKLFGKQAVVDTLVDDLAVTLGVKRGDLGIKAALKGLFCGSALTLTTAKGEVIKGLDFEETLIPIGEDILNINVDEDLGWVLIVEKEAIFQTLCTLGFASVHTLIGKGIIVTGKGYPDLATRQLVSVFSNELPERIPILCLVDADSHGMDILSVYKFGSKTMVHEQVAAERVEWIGVKRGDLERIGIPNSEMLDITAADVRKAQSMLRSETLPTEWVEELEQMLESGTKAEIEIIASHGQGAHALVEYVHGKIVEALGLDQEDDMIELSDMEDSDIVVKEEPEDLIDLDDF
ncbi:putative topoisomerase acting in meiosis protein [Rhizoctonia solani 123E]|uniref:DNA topoisomerase (ATP-hydrolyzing) n=1 Tax=Rhizoctonia solani 123E TaxID=1423351 RepID=A0A074S5D9_9AGAM|nr:putative topoisomerase acting in meiosis protein [Rhizoctonia solani 123E]